jgi:hypothetical protein
MVKYGSWRHEVTRVTVRLLVRGADAAGGTAPYMGQL